MSQLIIAAVLVLLPGTIYFITRIASAAFFHEKMQYHRKLVDYVNKGEE